MSDLSIRYGPGTRLKVRLLASALLSEGGAST